MWKHRKINIGGDRMEGLNPSAKYFERNQKQKKGDGSDIKARFEAYLGGGKKSGPGNLSSNPFRIGPRL
jgi:hypothetical protein